MISNTSSLEYQLKLPARFSFSFRDSRGFSYLLENTHWECVTGSQWRSEGYVITELIIAGPFPNTSGTLSNLH